MLNHVLFSLQELSDRVFYSARELPGCTGKLFLKVTKGFQTVLQWWFLAVWNCLVKYHPVALFYLVTLQQCTTKSSRANYINNTRQLQGQGHLHQQSSGKDGQGGQATLRYSTQHSNACPQPHCLLPSTSPTSTHFNTPTLSTRFFSVHMEC